jgi:hypothetical protein
VTRHVCHLIDNTCTCCSGALPRSLYSQYVPCSLICVEHHSLVLGSLFVPCSRVLFSFDVEPCPPASTRILALPAAKLAAPTASCLADHRRDGHAPKIGGLECALERAGRRCCRPAQPGAALSRRISERARALGAAPTLRTSRGLHTA